MNYQTNNKKIKRSLIVCCILIVLYVVLMLVLFTLSSFNTHIQRREDDILWSYNRNLKISDFVIVDELPNGVSASSCTGIVMVIIDSVPYGYQAVALFDRNRSKWSRRTKNLSEVLAHEQLHFDITQYMAQELNKDLRYCMCPRESNNKYHEYQYKLDSMQKLYDLETSHSRDIEKQKEWNNKIFHLIGRDLAKTNN